MEASSANSETVCSGGLCETGARRWRKTHGHGAVDLAQAGRPGGVARYAENPGMGDDVVAAPTLRTPGVTRPPRDPEVFHDAYFAPSLDTAHRRSSACAHLHDGSLYGWRRRRRHSG